MRTRGPTRTPGTEAFYDRVANLLMRHADRMVATGDMGVLQDRNLQMAHAFYDLEPTVTAATARLYRAAALSFIARHPGPMDSDARLILDPEPSESGYIREERLASVRAKNLTALRGAQQKAKWIPAADWDRLLSALASCKSLWALPSVQWLMATLLTGLRPCEWLHCQLQGTQLQVVNAKATNGRAHSDGRTLDLSRLPPDQFALVAAFIGTAKQFGAEGFRDLYNGVRSLIRLEARRTFGGRKLFPSLYTARHCFAARAKATYSRDEVAAMMGHASVATAARHYASAGFARGGHPLVVEPTPADVAAVRRAQAARDFLGSTFPAQE